MVNGRLADPVPILLFSDVRQVTKVVYGDSIPITKEIKNNGCFFIMNKDLAVVPIQKLTSFTNSKNFFKSLKLKILKFAWVLW